MAFLRVFFQVSITGFLEAFRGFLFPVSSMNTPLNTKMSAEPLLAGLSHRLKGSAWSPCNKALAT